MKPWLRDVVEAQVDVEGLVTRADLLLQIYCNLHQNLDSPFFDVDVDVEEWGS